MEVVEIDKRTRVSGLWILPGSRLEFNTPGQANTFVYKHGGTYKNANAKRKPAKADRTGQAASDSQRSEADATAKSD